MCEVGKQIKYKYQGDTITGRVKECNGEKITIKPILYNTNTSNGMKLLLEPIEESKYGVKDLYKGGLSGTHKLKDIKIDDTYTPPEPLPIYKTEENYFNELKAENKTVKMEYLSVGMDNIETIEGIISEVESGRIKIGDKYYLYSYIQSLRIPDETSGGKRRSRKSRKHRKHRKHGKKSRSRK
jgi:hypothetical protein